MSEATVPVPVSLLRKVADLVTCEAHGAWCWDHEASAWPCPMARLKQYVPDEPIVSDGDGAADRT